MDLSTTFLFELKSICRELWSVRGQSLAGLVTTGQSTGGLSWRLFQEYKEWGLLHLLVLSGSQYYAFSDSWFRLSQSLQKFLFKSSSPFWSRMLLVPASALYLQALRMPPPLLRCALLSFGIQLLQPLKTSMLVIICAVFVTHIVFIENLAPTDSAFLSWIAFFTLQFSKTLSKNPWVRALLVTSILHISITLFKGFPVSPWSWMIACLSNAISLPLFERVLFPCVGYISAFCLILCPLFALGLGLDYFKDYLAPAFSLILDLAILPVLVTNSAFRYTFSQ